MATSYDEYARFLAYGNQLLEVHLRLRDMLDDIRDGVVPEPGLAAHCVRFCTAVTSHHVGEDREVFPLLAARHPELRSFLDELTRDHEVIAGMLQRVIMLASEPRTSEPRTGEPRTGEPRDRSRLLREELNGLAAVLETHFLGEEKRLIGVLNALDPSVGLTPITDL